MKTAKRDRRGVIICDEGDGNSFCDAPAVYVVFTSSGGTMGRFCAKHLEKHRSKFKAWGYPVGPIEAVTGYTSA